MTTTMKLVPDHMMTQKTGKTGRKRINKFTKDPIIEEFDVDRRLRMAKRQLKMEGITIKSKSIDDKSNEIMDKIRIELKNLN